VITDPWYENAVVYCLSVESFMDANGDGHGDFEGLTRRLDYVEGLGITTLWLMPFQPSPPARAGEIGWGDYQVIALDNPALLVLLYAWRNNCTLFVHSLSDQSTEAVFTLPGENGRSDLLVNLLSEDHSHADDGRHDRVAMEPYGYRWFRVGALDEATRRSEV
jgi:hypothetical protein